MYSFVLALVAKDEPLIEAEVVGDDAVLTRENLESTRVGIVNNGDCRGVPSILSETGPKTGNIKQRCSRISSCVMFVGSVG